MYESGSWSTQGLREAELPFDYDWFLVPPYPGGIDSTIMLADHDGLGVSNHSSNKGLARDLVELISSADFQSTAKSLNTAGFPPRSDIEWPPDIDPVAADQYEAIKSLGSSTQLTVAVPYNPQIGPLLARMLAGEIDPEDVAGRLDELVTDARSGVSP